MTQYAVPFSGSEINPPNMNAGIQTIGSMVNTISGLQGIAQAAQLNPIAVQEANLKLTQEQAQTQSIQQINEERKTWNTDLSRQMQINADGTANMGFNTNDLYKKGDPILGADGKPVTTGDGQSILAGDAQVGMPKGGATTFAAKVMQKMPQTGQDYLQKLQATNTATAGANKSLLDLNTDEQQVFANAVIAANQNNTTPAAVHQILEDAVSSQPPATQEAMRKAQVQVEHMVGQAYKDTNTPEQNDAGVSAVLTAQATRMNSLKTVREQQNVQTGNLVTQSPSAQIQTSGSALTPSGATAVAAAVPLTGRAETYTDPAGGMWSVNVDKNTGQRSYSPMNATAQASKGPASAPAAPATKASAPAAAAPAAPATKAAAQAQVNQATAAQEDWKQTAADSATAAQNIGVLQEIKRLAPNAITGVGSDRQAMLAGLAGKLGMTVEEMQKTSTDLLAKNANMLALAGGNTDSARALAEVANPNLHMTPEAIQHATNQIIAQQQVKLMKQKFLQPVQTDPGAYSARLTQWNSLADPRLVQWKGMSPAERSAVLAPMSAQQQAKFRKQGIDFEKLRADNGLDV
jgi:hypothetical protein